MNIEFFKSLLSVQSYSGKEFRMFARIVRELKTIEGVRMRVKDGNLYVTKGYAETYPCVVAHIDTVHHIFKGELTAVEVRKGFLTGFDLSTMKQRGIGGDDKSGIFIAIEALRVLDCAKVAFFREEETGCQGSYMADMSFFEDTAFVLQCDRRGNTDFITDASGIELSGKGFQDAISDIVYSFGYKYEFGMMTDVMALKENGLGVACANMSCGYYNPHTDYESISIRDTENCLEMVLQICETFGHIRFPHHAPKKKRWATYSSKYGSWDEKGSEDLWGQFSKKKEYGDEARYEALMRHYGITKADMDEIDVECINCGHEMSEYEAERADPYCDYCGMTQSEIRRFQIGDFDDEKDPLKKLPLKKVKSTPF